MSPLPATGRSRFSLPEVQKRKSAAAQSPLKTTQRGYGRAHRLRRARWAPKVAAGLVACARCGRLIAPGASWDLGHDDLDRSVYVGPEHTACNRATSTHRVLRESEVNFSRRW